jgi:hypothetical protein
MLTRRAVIARELLKVALQPAKQSQQRLAFDIAVEFGARSSLPVAPTGP